MYGELMGQADKYMAKAIVEKDVDLKKFYFNVSRNYERMARELTIEEAVK